MHIPVLQKEVIEYLNPKPNENFIDCTVGGGGHAALILEKNGENGKVLGIDLDPDQIKNCDKNIRSSRLVLVNDSYANLKKICEKYNFYPVNGILFDLGMSSWHTSDSSKGFSFLKDQPLDMRYGTGGEGFIGAEEIVNNYSKANLEKILTEYGEERYAEKIAEGICRYREVKPIRTTFQLVNIISGATPLKYKKEKIHFATRTFQALRIEANNELVNLKETLPQAIELLSVAGRLVAISFHSLEDRIVKNFLKDLSETQNKKIKILTKKPITAGFDEIKINHRARSAKLRAVEKL